MKDHHTNKKNTDDLKTMFCDTDVTFPINEQIKQHALERLGEEISGKEVLPLHNRRKIWQNHLRYAHKEMWVFHVLGCIFMLLLLQLMSTHNIERQTMITLSMILAGMLGSLSVLEVGQMCFADIAELSETCFFNVRQMTAFDMVFSGIINLTALSAGIVIAGCRWEMGLVRIGLYFLVPFVFAQCVCLGALLTESGRRNPWLIAGIGIFLAAAYAVFASSSRLYTDSALFVWGAALTIGCIVLGIQIRALFTEIGKGDILCTN